MNARETRNGLAALLLALSWVAAAAAPVPAGLSVQATVTLDTVNSADPSGAATQSGTLRHLAGAGPVSTATFTDTPASIAPSASLGGALTETFNGVGASFSMSGTSTGGASTTGGLFADYVFLLSNSSATETFTITFFVQASNSVSASGDDAFANSKFVVLDSGNNELYASDKRVDTLNPGNDVDLDSANDFIIFILSPGGSASFTAFQSQDGGVFAPGGYSADMTAFISLADVRSSGGGGGGGDPNGVPLPGTLPLALAAFMALALASGRRGS